ncbi:MAG TPA: dienelactone hydrolase family protein [Acidimicrobiales bacterium]|jgi:carboxymethylenebutenolidase|nr:dienelactone hydrolase family protein [Acidimicrobiales bacterium]
MSERVGPRFPLYVTGDTASPRALVVLQEGFGVNDHIRDVADRFTEEGFFVVAPHLYHRDGSPEVPYDDVEQAKTLMSHLGAEEIRNDLDATTDFLASVGYGAPSIGAIGFCMGGSVAFYAATMSTFGAAVSFYGGGISTGRMGLPPLLELANELRNPWLGLFGDLDAGIPIADVEALREVTSTVSSVTEIVRYPNADHGFHCNARPSVYNREAAQSASSRAITFLTSHLEAKLDES